MSQTKATVPLCKVGLHWYHEIRGSFLNFSTKSLQNFPNASGSTVTLVRIIVQISPIVTTKYSGSSNNFAISAAFSKNVRAELPINHNYFETGILFCLCSQKNK